VLVYFRRRRGLAHFTLGSAADRAEDNPRPASQRQPFSFGDLSPCDPSDIEPPQASAGVPK